MSAATARLATLLLADARLPSGAYSHSAGLEPAVFAGLGVDGVYPYLVSRLNTVMRVETAAAVLACRRARDDDGAAQPAGVDLFRPIESALDARTPSPAQRDASRRLGRGMLRLASTLKPGHPAVVRLEHEAPKPTRPVALGVIGASFDVDEAQVALLCCYDDAQSVVAAALKLLPIDPMVGTGWIIDAADLMEDVAGQALGTRTEDDIPALSAPWMEHWAQEHTTRTRRLFVA